MITDEGLVNTPILAHAASDPSGVMFSMEEIADDSNHYLAQELDQMLSGVDAQTVSELKSDQQFLFFHGERSPGDQDRQARLCIVSQCIQQTIDELRLNLLAAAPSLERLDRMTTRHFATLAWVRTSSFH